MKIVFAIDRLLGKLFPEVDLYTNDNDLIQYFNEYYTHEGIRPMVTVENGFVIVEIDLESIINFDRDFLKVITLCEKRNYSKAKPLLESLIQKNPYNSEFYRVLGQILSDEGNFEEAINHLIEALRWDPKNTYALIMMGNIFAREKDDHETALLYFNKAIEINPEEYIALNNIGANLLKIERYDEAETVFNKAYNINSNYPNTSYGLSIVNINKRKYLKAFDFCVESLKKSQNDVNVNQAAYHLLSELSNQFIRNENGFKVIDDYKKMLEEKSGKEILIKEEQNLPTPAKIEIAENYDRNYHLVKYNKRIGVEHLIMHELVHLEYVLNARGGGRIFYLFLLQKQKKSFYVKMKDISMN